MNKILLDFSLMQLITNKKNGAFDVEMDTFLWMLEAQILKQSKYEVQAVSLIEKANLDRVLDQQDKRWIALESKLSFREYTPLGRVITIEGDCLGRASSRLMRIKIASRAHFPSANDILQRYEKLVIQLMEKYGNAAYDMKSEKPEMVQQLEFADTWLQYWRECGEPFIIVIPSS